MTTSMRNTRTRLASLLVALGAIGATSMGGCTQADEVPPEDLDAINAGVNVDIGTVAADNLLIITSAEGEPGRLLGRLMNTSEEAVEVRFADDDDEITVTLQPDQDLEFEENEHIFETTEAPPGALAATIISADGASEEVQIPVFDGSLEYYRPFVPDN